MKKRILLTFAIMAMLICVFAISVSAAVVTDEIKYSYFPQDAEVEQIDGIIAENHIHADILESYPDAVNARVRLKCSCAKKYHIYPTYYITSVSENEYFRFDYKEINGKNPCGQTHNKNTIIALEMPNGYTIFDGYAENNNITYGVRRSSSLEYIDMSTCTTLATLSTQDKHEPFNECGALKYVKMSSATTNIPAWGFYKCVELRIVDIPRDSRLEKIGAQAFINCSKLTALYLPDSIKSIGYLSDGESTDSTQTEGDQKSTFYNCKALFFVNNPEDTVKPTVYYMPRSLEKITGGLFKEFNNLSDVVVFGENFTYLNNGFTFAKINKGTFVFEGDFTAENSKFEYSCQMTNVSIYFTHPNVRDGSFIRYATSWNGATPSKCYAYICSTGLKAELTKQTYPTANALYYAVLDFKQDGFAHLIENEAVGVHYDNYFENGYSVNACFCGAHLVEAEATLEPVFKSRGYSVPEDSSRGYFVTQGIMVNRDMLALLGEDVDFGIVVDVNVDGVLYDPLADGATSLSLIDSEYNCFDIKVSGIPEEHTETAIVFCGYVRVGETVSYLDGGATYNKVVGISYQAIAVNTSDKEE